MRHACVRILGLVATLSLVASPTSAANRIGVLTLPNVPGLSFFRGSRPRPPVHVGVEPWLPAFSPDGTRLYVTDIKQPQPPSSTGALLVVNPANGQLLGTVPLSGYPGKPAVHPDGSRVYVPVSDLLDGANAKVVVVDTTTLATSEIPVPDGPWGTAFNPTSGLLYVVSRGPLNPPPGSPGGAFTAIDTATDTVAASAVVPVDVGDVVVHPDGTRAYVGGMYSNQVYVVDTATLAITKTFPATYPASLVVSRSGQDLYVESFCGDNDPSCNLPGSLTIVDTATDTARAKLPVGHRPQQVAVDPKNGRVWVASGMDSMVSVINPSCRPRVMHPLPAAASSVGLAFGPCPKCKIRSRPTCK